MRRGKKALVLARRSRRFPHFAFHIEKGWQSAGIANLFYRVLSSKPPGAQGGKAGMPSREHPHRTPRAGGPQDETANLSGCGGNPTTLRAQISLSRTIFFCKSAPLAALLSFHPPTGSVPLTPRPGSPPHGWRPGWRRWCHGSPFGPNRPFRAPGSRRRASPRPRARPAPG